MGEWRKEKSDRRWKAGERRQEKGDRRQEKGDRRWEEEDGSKEMGEWRWDKEDGRKEKGERRQKKGDERKELEKGDGQKEILKQSCPRSRLKVVDEEVGDDQGLRLIANFEGRNCNANCDEKNSKLQIKIANYCK